MCDSTKDKQKHEPLKTVITSSNRFSMLHSTFVINCFYFFFSQVVSEANINGWFEPFNPEMIQWLKELRTVQPNQEANIKCCFAPAGYVSTVFE